jgi:hypothetical protein
MTSLNMAGWKIYMVGGLEVLSGLVFLTERLRSIGIPLASAYLGAAVSAHVQSGQYFAVMPTFFIMGCCWLGSALRYPQLMWSLSANSQSSGVRTEVSSPDAFRGTET